ncbi:C80 family cysteine peptidase [Providencia rettgeri]|uniref:C80 family cysteine peptidase n=1 Tax=Providencia rettgeri TaxID=587 RepID=UPI00257414B4|nr:C80 family cysteine peptidase [Providencia rettgeri]MDL9985765.1 C80 family cysteine peptidase [Providencia rettgeri]
MININDKKTNDEIINKDDDFIFLTEHIDGRPLVGEQSSELKNISNWFNPIDEFTRLTIFHHLMSRPTSDSTYNYHVLIQIGGDDSVAKSTGRLLAKFPSNSLVIQFDIKNEQWKVLHGDLQTQVKGKIRWAVIGHGQYTGRNQQSHLEGYQAYQLITGLKYLKNDVLKAYPPNKIVLAGCQLGRGGVNENFVFRASVELAKYGIYLPVVGYNRPIGITSDSKKITWPYNLAGEKQSTKNWRLEININQTNQQSYINGKHASLYFIDELRSGELEVWQLIKDEHSTAMDIFRDPNNEYKIDIDLIKKVAFNHDAYAIFKQKLNAKETQFNSDFRSELIREYENVGILETPLWLMINKINVNANPQKINDTVKIIIRSGRGVVGKKYAEDLVNELPNSTLLFQLNPNTMEFFSEYGDIEHLLKVTKQQWILIDNIHSEPGFIQNYANSLNVLKTRYGFKMPENIILYLTDKKALLTKEEKVIFGEELTSKLKTNGIYTKVFFENNFEPRHKIKALLEDISIGNLLAEHIDINKHLYLKGYFTFQDGSVDKNKINIAAYDPIISKKINKICDAENENDFSHMWNSIFIDDDTTSIKQQAIEVKNILEFLSLQPEKINYLGKQSIKRLSELFPSGQGFNHAEVLKLVQDPMKLREYNQYIDDFLILYIDIKTPFGNEKSLKKEFRLTLDLHEKRKSNYAALSQLSYKVGFNVTVNKLPVEIHSFENICFLRFLQHSNLTDEQSLQLNEKFEVLTKLTRKKELSNITNKEQEVLNRFDEIYQSNLDLLGAVSNEINEQSHILLFDNMENNQIITFQSDKEIYTITSYSRNDKYFLTLSDTTGVELVIGHSEFNQAKKHLSNVFNDYINQEITQEDGSVSTRGNIAGFKHKVGEALFGEVQIINTESEAYLRMRQSIMSELDIFFKSSAISVIDDTEVTFGEQVTSLNKLRDIGATINGEPLDFKHIQVLNWEGDVKFNPDKLAFQLTFLTEDLKDTNLIKMLNKSLQNDQITRRIDVNSEIQPRAVLHEQLQIIQGSQLDNQAGVDKAVGDLRRIGMKLPAYAKIANYSGQGIGSTGIFLTINSVYQLIDELDNPALSEQEKREMQKNLDLACANAFFNYGDMVLQPILLKLAYKQYGSFNVSSKITARITIIFNLIGMGLDIYQACEAFEQLDRVTNDKERQDLIVNGSLSIANIIVGGVTIIGIIIGSSVIPVVGLIVAGSLLIGGMVYTGIRAVEQIEDELGESLCWDEKAREGIRAALGFPPSDNILNRFSYKQHLAHFKNINWQQDLDMFKSSFLYQGFDEHLQLVGKPILVEHIKHYIYYRNNSKIISSVEFVDVDSRGPLSHIDSDEIGPYYTIEQINFIRENYHYDSQDNRWIKSFQTQRVNELNFNYRFRLVNKTPPIAYKNIGEEVANDILVLNPEYDSLLLKQFLHKNELTTSYNIKKKQSVATQLSSLSASELRLFQARNNYTNTIHPDINNDIRVNRLGEEFLNQPIDIARELLSENPRVIYEGMQNIGYRYENEAKQKNISFNPGNGIDVIVGKKNSKNLFNINAGSKFLVGGEKDDITNLSLLFDNNIEEINEIYFDGNGGNNSIIIKDFPSNSKIDIDLNKETSEVAFINHKVKKIHLHNVNDVMLIGDSSTTTELLGNKESNTLDAGAMIAFIQGMEGDDHLIFESGIVNGGEGDDNYFLRRVDWRNNQDELNDDLLELSAVIIEKIQGQSRVNLGYMLSEIKGASISGNDLILTIEMKLEEPETKILTLNVTLKNTYRIDSNGRGIFHRYQLYTRDGFVLNTKLNNLDLSASHIISENIFNITYQGGASSTMSIDESEKTISVDNEIYDQPLWGDFKFHGLASKLEYKGENNDGHLLMVSRNSYITVTKGRDVYQVNPDQIFQGKIIFDFSNIKPEMENEFDMTILLPYENGFDIKALGKSIFLYDKFSNEKIEISFINLSYQISKEIHIKDGHGNLFRIKMGQDSYNIEPIEFLELPTVNNDYIKIPKGYNFRYPILDTNNGDDLIDDNSMIGNIINSGDGNDIIISNGGGNVLYGGNGDDYVYGGENSDLILSDLGNDKLDGQGGNDHYLIDGSKGGGNTEILDQVGFNNIHLFNFKTQYEVIDEREETYHIYTSQSNLRTVKVKMPKNNENSNNQVCHHQRLPSHMPAHIHNDGMAHLVRYLAEQRQYKKELTPEQIWHPMDEFKNFSNELNFSSIIDTKTKNIHISENTPFRRLFIRTKGPEQKVWDRSGVGRVFKAQAVTGAISIPDGIYGNNVLYASISDTNLYGGEGNDVFISNGSNGLLTDASGKNSFIINGEIVGWNSLYSLGGENTIYLINFNKDVIREEPDHRSNATRYTYTSDQGRSVKIFQYPNTIAPTVVHVQSLEGQNEHSTQQKLNHLVETLATLRLQDEENCIGIQDIEYLQKNWEPTNLVDNYMKKAS